jgi:biopolymer transport protein ExbB/TolQ
VIHTFLVTANQTVGEAPSGMVERLRNGLDSLGAEWVLWLLFLLSAVSVAFMVERWLFFRKRRVDTKTLGKALRKHLAAGQWDGALGELNRYSDAMEAQVSHTLITQRDRSIAALEDVKEALVEESRLEYEKRLGFLATVGTNAPFVGLFGTVIGIIGAFSDLEKAYDVASVSTNKTQLIMASISEALVATAVGLLVAIPAVAAYNTFQRRVEKSIARTDVMARTVIARIREDK